jgi:hypothetical protein
MCDRHTPNTGMLVSSKTAARTRASALIGDLRLVQSAVQRWQSVTDELV